MTDKPIENCYRVVPSQLLAGEYPRNEDEDSSRSKQAFFIVVNKVLMFYD